MSCINTHIDKFCNEFISLNLNMGGFTGPTMEVQVLGDRGKFYEDHEDFELTQSLLGRLEGAGIPIPGEWVIVSVKTSRSSSGVITTIRLADKVWTEVQNKTIGLNHKTHGDIMLGHEYFNVTGVSVGTYTSPPRNLLLSWNYLNVYFDKLNTGQYFINTAGGIEYNNKVSPKDLFKNFVPGLPDPRVEFGNIYYHAQHLFNAINLDGKGITGLMNSTGTQYDVVSGLAAMHGYAYSANGVTGHELVDINSINDFGKKDLLYADGVQIPDEAISSSIERDYGSGYSQSSRMFVETPGRYRKDYSSEENSRKDEDLIVRTLGGYVHDTARMDGRISAGDIVGESYDLADLAWHIIKGHPAVSELGRSSQISNGTTSINFDDIYGNSLTKRGFKWFVNAYDNMDEGKFIQDAAMELGLTKEYNKTLEYDAQQNMNLYFQNYNRFQYKDNWGLNDITHHGDFNPDWSGADTRDDTFGFENFGTANFPRGGKTWYTDSGGDISFVGYSTRIKNSPFSDGVYNTRLMSSGGDVGTVHKASRPGWSMSSSSTVGAEPKQGMIVLDYGPNSIPSLNPDCSWEGYSAWIDGTQSVGGDGQVFNGVAAVHMIGLKQQVRDMFQGVKDALSSVTSQNPDELATIGFYGEETDYFTNYGPPRVKENTSTGKPPRTLHQHANIPEDEQVQYLNPVSVVWRNRSSTATCGEANTLFNRKFFTFNLGVSLFETKKYNPATGESEAGDTAVKYLDDSGLITRSTFHEIKNSGGCNISVPYLDKISFSLVNSFYAIPKAAEKHLSGLSISVVGGKLTANYSFSQSVVVPDYRGLAASRVQLQNLIG